MQPASEYVHLRTGPRGGLTIPAEPLRLVFELQARGFLLTAEGDTLLVQPQARLTMDDFIRIQRWKFHLLALLAYEPPEVQ